MRTLDAAAVRAATPWGDLIAAITETLAVEAVGAPERSVHQVGLPDGGTGSLLLMPAWVDGELIGVKAVTYFPSNAGTAVPTVNAAYLAFDGRTGQALAVLDGDELTARRTAAVSALFVDTVAGASRSGDLAQPLAEGVITETAIAADLRALASGEHPGRTSPDEITLFKSAGFALADLAAARLALR